jgi:hypothetical protein
MHNRIRGFVSAALFAALSTVLSFSVAAQKVPKQLKPPANEKLLLQVHAKGDQVYSCKSDAAKFTWTLKAPDAQLFDKNGKPFGKHFAGPSWEANDGSRVTGKADPNPPSPAPIPFRGFSSESSATMAAVCSRAPQVSSASAPRVAKHQPPAATLRTRTRKPA